MAQSKPAVNVEKIREAIEKGIPISITTYTLPHDMEVYMAEVLGAFLKELKQDHMIQHLEYCLNELVVNAKKANTKRVYFAEKKLDIFDQTQYEHGMKSFKQDTLNNINYYLKKQKESGLFVKLILQAKNNKMKIEVRNNAKLTIFEYKRITERITQAKKYSSIEEAVMSVLDDSEGAGLGLVIIILMLEKLGMTPENFQTICEHGETITRIILPVSQTLQSGINIIAEEFKNSVNDLPQFPETITRISQMLSNPDSSMVDISNQIVSDVAISGELLKLVNSASFGLKNPCKTIVDAVKFVGIRGIRNILYSIGSMNVFAASDEKNAKLWKHAHKTAFYSYNLAKNLCSGQKNIIDDSFTCGLLHDMGKLIFESTHPEFLDNVKNVCLKKEVSPEVFEMVLSGVNHGEIGAQIAEKWNFPQTLIDSIRYHHSPDLAPSENKKLCYLIYIADAMVHYNDDSLAFDEIEQEALAEFNIKDMSTFQKIAEKLKAGFEAAEK